LQLKNHTNASAAHADRQPKLWHRYGSECAMRGTVHNTRKSSRQIRETLMRLLTTLILLTICLTAIGQTSSTKKWVDTEVKYTDSTGKVVIVQNSFPKGPGRYTDSAGKSYVYVIFWTCVINESATPLQLSITFPADPFTIFPSPDSHIRIFLPPDTMTVDKIPLYGYGLTNLQSFLDAEFDKPSMLQKTVNSKEECLFYIPVLIYESRGRSSARAALVLKGQDLFFRISMAPDVDSVLIPCGQLIFKK
jgi:hypothetical protein